MPDLNINLQHIKSGQYLGVQIYVDYTLSQATYYYFKSPSTDHTQGKKLKYICKIWYLSAIEIIDTQVARRGRQYHRNPLTKKKPS